MVPRPGVGGCCGGPGAQVQSPSRVAGRWPLLWPREPHADIGVAAFFSRRGLRWCVLSRALRETTAWRGSRTAHLMSSPEDFGVCHFEGHGHEVREKVRNLKGSQQRASCASFSFI